MPTASPKAASSARAFDRQRRTMEALVAEYLRFLALEKNASEHTVKSYREDLTQAVDFFKTKLGAQAEMTRLTPRHLRAHAAWLHEQGYAKTTIARRIAAVRSWCRFLCRQGTLTANPAEGLRGPRQEKKLPHFLGPEELARLLEATPADTALGHRDRAILETLYSAGLRVSELTQLNAEDVDFDSGLATVRGKGKRERLALLGPPCLEALRRWLTEREALGRTHLKSVAPGRTDLKSVPLFVNKRGTRLTARSVGRLLEKYLALAG